MKKIILALSFIIFGSVMLSAQHNLLVLEKLGNAKNFKYYKGDKIEFRTSDSVDVKGVITDIKDSTIVLDYYSEISIKKIHTVYRVRWFVSILSKVLMIGGAGIVVIEAINGAISSTGNMNETLMYSGVGAAAAGALLIPLQKAKYPIESQKWKVKILPMEDEFNYQKNKPITF